MRHTGETGEVTCCPTCETLLPDPTLVLETLITAQQETQVRGVENNKKVTEKEKELQRLTRLQQQKLVKETELRNAELAHETATTENSTLQSALVEATKNYEQISVANQKNIEEADEATTRINQLTQQIEESTQRVKETQIAQDAHRRLTSLQNQLENVTNILTDAQNKLEETQEEEQQLRVDPEEQTYITESYQKGQQNFHQAEVEKLQAENDYQLANEKVSSAQRVKDAEELRMRARTETLVLLEQQTAVRDALDTFRKDRIASLAPELSEIATDHINKMTNGKFVAFELDEEFTAVLTDNQGNMRPASWLSGGEESAAALSLRLAIGEVIAGHKGGLLWMDEPQTAMDAQRRPAMMSVIRSLSGRQPIIISHVTEATDMVDLVVDVVPNENDGSIIVISGSVSDTDTTNVSTT